MNSRERQLLQRVHDAGINLRVENGKLVYLAPKGVMTAEMLATLVELKPAIIDEYEERAGILEYDANMSKLDAEVMATRMIRSGGGL